MAPGLTVTTDRRRQARAQPEEMGWRRLALLRPGQDVELLNLSPGGALVESPFRMTPGMPTELQLSGPSRRAIRGRLDRCRVVGLDPLRFEAVIIFDEPMQPSKSG